MCCSASTRCIAYRKGPFSHGETTIMSTMETFEYNPEMPSYETGWGGEAAYESEVFSEAEVLELAGQLTEVTTEVELDRFLGDLISKAGRAPGQVVPSPTGPAGRRWVQSAATPPPS